MINGVDEKLLKFLRSAPDICSDPISETFIHLDEETANYLLLHEDRVSNDNLNRRKKSTLIREQQLETILEDFSSLNPEQQLNSNFNCLIISLCSAS